MLKNSLTEFKKKLQELTKEHNLPNLENLKNKFINEIDKKIAILYQKKEMLKEAIFRKKELKKQKLSVWKKLRKTPWNMIFRYIISMPFIYMIIIPAVIWHVFIEIYHQICFRLYKIPLSKPSEHFCFDRSHLAYLNWFEKINCAYCSYVNCLLSYSREIIGKTERYWCPIKHAKKMKDAHNEYEHFVDYLEGKQLREKWPEVRKFKDKDENKET